MSNTANKTESSQSFERRSFLKGATTLAAVGLAAAGTAVASESAPQAPVAPTWVGRTPEDFSAMGGSYMSLYELNEYRRKLIESVDEDYVDEDGTVIPAVWRKVRTLVDTYGPGINGDGICAGSFEFFMEFFEYNEDYAQAYLDMPWGVKFCAEDFAEQSGRTVEECKEICDHLAQRGALWRAVRDDVPFYHQLAFAHGLTEFNYLDNYFHPEERDFVVPSNAVRGVRAQNFNCLYEPGSCFFHVIPTRGVLAADSKYLVRDDIDAVIEKNDIIAVSPCQCRIKYIPEGEHPLGDELKDYWLDFSSGRSFPLETCMIFGEEAEYYIWAGYGRQITKEEAHAIWQRSCDAGMITQCARTGICELICACHPEGGCSVMGAYKALGAEGFAQTSIYGKVSRHELKWDAESCLKCGICVDKCTMGAVHMDEETGYPTIDELCVGCGICCYDCPVEARHLKAKEEPQLPLSLDMLDDYNVKASWRIEHGLL